jgi:hypothetical protein
MPSRRKLRPSSSCSSGGGPAAFGKTETVAQARDGQIELKAGVNPVYITRPGG